MALACGNWTLTRPSWLKVVETMKNMSSTSSTSMKLITLISGSSRRPCWRRFTSSSPRGEVAALVQRVDQLHRFLFHADHQPLDFAAQVPIGDERGNGHGEARGGRDQRLADAPGKRSRIAEPVRGDGVEGVDDAGHGAEEAEERCDRGDRAEGIEEALELVHDVPAAVLER